MPERDVAREVFPTDGAKTYGLMEVVEGTSPKVEEGPEDTVFSWPHLLIREVLVFFGLLIVLVIVSLLFDAPLEELANPAHPTNPAKAPWYFLGLQDLVSYDALIGGIVVPAGTVILLMLVPYIDRDPKGVGVWFSPQRKLAITLFTIFMVTQLVLIFVGTYMRGPNWAFYWPWQEWVGGH